PQDAPLPGLLLAIRARRRRARRRFDRAGDRRPHLLPPRGGAPLDDGRLRRRARTPAVASDLRTGGVRPLRGPLASTAALGALRRCARGRAARRAAGHPAAARRWRAAALADRGDGLSLGRLRARSPTS